MNNLKNFIYTLAFALMLISCGKKIETKNENPVEKKTEITTAKQSSLSVEAVETLLNHMGKDLVLYKTTTKELAKIYSYQSKDDYGNHLLEVVSKNGIEKLNYNFSFEENTLNYISIKSNTSPDEIITFLQEKYGNAQEHTNIEKLSWEHLKEFNIIVHPKETNWELNIEPKDYYPGF